MKKFWLSKTFWWGILITLYPALEYSLTSNDFSWQSIVISSFTGIVTIFLRFITKEPIDSSFITETVEDIVEDILDKSGRTKT